MSVLSAILEANKLRRTETRQEVVMKALVQMNSARHGLHQAKPWTSWCYSVPFKALSPSFLALAPDVTLL